MPNKIQDFKYVQSLYSFLAHLLEKSVYLPVTIPSLNSTIMIPKFVKYIVVSLIEFLLTLMLNLRKNSLQTKQR